MHVQSQERLGSPVLAGEVAERPGEVLPVMPRCACCACCAVLQVARCTQILGKDSEEPRYIIKVQHYARVGRGGRRLPALWM